MSKTALPKSAAGELAKDVRVSAVFSECLPGCPNERLCAILPPDLREEFGRRFRGEPANASGRTGED